ncbi:MAG: TRAP transporter TatT component family protein [Bacteroidota bacterium]|nr:TRAP transporter TatT component family protein [Bacteroidota bacterium]
MKIIITITFLLAVISGCSIQQIAIRSMGGLMENGFIVLNEESDLDIAEKSAASNLKLLEAMIKSDPKNEKLLLLATMGYSSYALGFVEDDSPGRARNFYLRSKNYGMLLLKKNKAFAATTSGDLENFSNALRTFSKSDIPLLFWTGIGWGSYVSLSLTEPEALADLPKVEAIMKYVAENDSSYFYGGAHFFLGALYGSRPKVLGGNPDEAKKHFEKCLHINGGKFLMSYVYYARTYAVQIQDQNLFEELLTKVDETSIDVLPEARLSNAIAKNKAERLRNQINDLF